MASLNLKQVEEFLKQALDTTPRCCATCKHWEALPAENTTAGNCLINAYYETKGALTHMSSPFLTLDLDRCTKWEGR